MVLQLIELDVGVLGGFIRISLINYKHSVFHGKTHILSTHLLSGTLNPMW